MKNLRNYLKVFVLLFSFVFVQCSKEEVKVIDGFADVIARNLTVGESIEGEMIYIQMGGNKEAMNVSNGDVLEFVYTPNPSYAKYSYEVSFDVFGSEKRVSGVPYSIKFKVENVKAGEYYVRCDAVCNSKDAQINEWAGFYIRVIE